LTEDSVLPGLNGGRLVRDRGNWQNRRVKRGSKTSKKEARCQRTLKKAGGERARREEYDFRLRRREETRAKLTTPIEKQEGKIQKTETAPPGVDLPSQQKTPNQIERRTNNSRD